MLVFLFSLFFVNLEGLVCNSGYKCWKDTSRKYRSAGDVVFVRPDNVRATCEYICQNALNKNTQIYSCDKATKIPKNIDEFTNIGNGLSIKCKQGSCWGGKSNVGSGQIWVKKGVINKNTAVDCYFPDSDNYFKCDKSVGNANCFGTRFSLVCPCSSKPLTEACTWPNPGPMQPKAFKQPDWYKKGENKATTTNCIDRINYWRKRACDENWYECPPAGLPPMTECTCCHECANSQSEYDRTHGAHASFTRCGDMSQGQGPGKSCAAVIDGFISERGLVKGDTSGVKRCRGHCGPIVAPGCLTFFWGHSNGFYTLNWRTCNVDKCQGYCNKPNSNKCFKTVTGPTPNGGFITAPNTNQCQKQSTPTPKPVTPTPKPVQTIPTECPRPARWCSHAGSTFKWVTCRGKRRATCTDNLGKIGQRYKKNGVCVDSWPGGVIGCATVNTKRPFSWCKHTGSKFHWKRCIGQLIPTCTDNRGSIGQRYTVGGKVIDTWPRGSNTCPKYSSESMNINVDTSSAAYSNMGSYTQLDNLKDQFASTRMKYQIYYFDFIIGMFGIFLLCGIIFFIRSICLTFSKKDKKKYAPVNISSSESEDN